MQKLFFKKAVYESMKIVKILLEIVDRKIIW